MSILDPKFEYVPAAEVPVRGVLARWLALRKAEAERREQEKVANVTKLKTKVRT